MRWEELEHHFRAETRQDPPPFGEGVVEWDYSRYTRALGLGRTPGLDTLKRRGCTLAAGRPAFRNEVAERLRGWSEERGWRFLRLSARPSTVVPDPVIYHLGVEITHPDSLIFCAAGQQGKPALGKRPRSPAMRVPLKPAERWLIAADRVRRRVRAETATRGLVLFVDEAEQLTPSALSILCYFLDTQCAWKSHLLSSPAQIYIAFATPAREEDWFRETLHRFSPRAEPFVLRDEIGPQLTSSGRSGLRISVEQEHVLAVFRHIAIWMRRDEARHLLGDSASTDVEYLTRRGLITRRLEAGTEVLAAAPGGGCDEVYLTGRVQTAVTAFRSNRRSLRRWCGGLMREYDPAKERVGHRVGRDGPRDCSAEPRLLPLKAIRAATGPSFAGEVACTSEMRLARVRVAAARRQYELAKQTLLALRIGNRDGEVELSTLLAELVSLGRTVALKVLPSRFWSTTASRGNGDSDVDLGAIAADLFFGLRGMTLDAMKSRYEIAVELLGVLLTDIDTHVDRRTNEVLRLLALVRPMLNRAFQFLFERGSRAIRPLPEPSSEIAQLIAQQAIPGFLVGSVLYSEAMSPNAPSDVALGEPGMPAIRDFFLTSGCARDSRVALARIIDSAARHQGILRCRGLADEVAMLLDFSVPAESKRQVLWSLSALFGSTGREVYAAMHVLSSADVAGTSTAQRSSDAQWAVPSLLKAGDLGGALRALAQASVARGASPYASATAAQSRADICFDSLQWGESLGDAWRLASDRIGYSGHHLNRFGRLYAEALQRLAAGSYLEAEQRFDEARHCLGRASPGEAKTLSSAAARRAAESRALERFRLARHQREAGGRRLVSNDIAKLASCLREARIQPSIGAATRALEELFTSEDTLDSNFVVSLVLLLRELWGAQFGGATPGLLPRLSRVAPATFERVVQALRASYTVQVPGAEEVRQFDWCLGLLASHWDFGCLGPAGEKLVVALRPSRPPVSCRVSLDHFQSSPKTRGWSEDGALISVALSMAARANSRGAPRRPFRAEVLMAGTLGRTEVIWHRSQMRISCEWQRRKLLVKQDDLLAASTARELPPRDSAAVRVESARGFEGGLSGQDRHAIRRFVGTSRAASEVRKAIETAAACRLPVLIHGETGTGKGLVAEIISTMKSGSAIQPVTLNCSAVPDELIELEMFGAKRGAFTGAVEDKGGLVAAADGTALVLDEVDSMSRRMQAAMLRVLDSGEYRRVGGSRTRASTFRLISCAGPRLLRKLEQGEFRQDLYYRISAFVIEIPPLRARREDAVTVAERFASSRGFRLADGCDQLILESQWPGNVRQLLNVLEVARSGCEGDVLRCEILAEALGRSLLDTAWQDSPCANRNDRQHGPIWLDQLPDRFTTGDALRLTKLSRRTIQRRLGRLVRRGALERHGAGRSTFYQKSFLNSPG